MIVNERQYNKTKEQYEMLLRSIEITKARLDGAPEHIIKLAVDPGESFAAQLKHDLEDYEQRQESKNS